MALSKEKASQLWNAACRLDVFRIDDIVAATGIFPAAATEHLQQLVKEGRLRTGIYNHTRVYFYPRTKGVKAPHCAVDLDGLWQVVRQLKTFTTRDMIDRSVMTRSRIQDFLTPLVAGKVLAAKEMPKRRVYTLVKDSVCRPLLERDGKKRRPRTHERMWKAMKVLKLFDCRDLSLAAEVTKRTATVYCNRLARAGYLEKRKSRFLLVTQKDTGPQAPAFKDGQLTDPNLGYVVWPESEAA